MVSDYTPPPVTQATLKGAPSVTVSPVGLAQGLPRNNNANYGPDTPGTTTCGCQEAINSGATSIELLNIPGYHFNTSTSILLPATHGINFVGRGMQPFNTGTEGSYINYSGTGYAIDTAPSPVANIKGYIDGILCITPNGSGVHFNGVIYDIGYLGCIGGGVPGSVGINFDFLSAGSMAHIKMLRVGYYPLHIRINQDHFTCDHIETSYTVAGQNAIIEKVAGWGMNIGYWHHFCSGGAPSNGLLIDTASAGQKAMRIGVILWEASTYNLPTALIVSNSGTQSETLTLGVGTIAAMGSAPSFQSKTSNTLLFDGISGNNNFNSVVLYDLYLNGSVPNYSSKATAGYGLTPLYGLDNRHGLTAADAAAITLYTVPAGNTTSVFKLKARIVLTAGTTPAATYKLTWIENGVIMNASLSATALNTQYNTAWLVQPDANTAITIQLTAISGTGTTANVACTVEEAA